MNLAELADQDPIAAQAAHELTSLAQQGEFFVLAAHGASVEELKELFAFDKGYWLGQICIYNAQPDLTDRPDLRTLIFITETDNQSRDAFLNKFQQSVVPYRWALQQSIAGNLSASPVEAIATAAHIYQEKQVLLEAARKLAARGQRVIGGFAVSATLSSEPKHYIGQVYTSRELWDLQAFIFREANLQAPDLPMDEAEKRKILTLASTQTVNDVVMGQIVRELPPEAEVIETLYPNGSHTRKSFTDALDSIQHSAEENKLSYPSASRRVGGDNKKRNQNAKHARRTNRKRK